MTTTIIGRRCWPVLALATLILTGCATPEPLAVPAEPAPAVAAPVAAPDPEPRIPVVEPPPPVLAEPAPVTELPAAPVAIVLASREPAYEAVVNELDPYLESYSVYDLSDKSQPPETAFRAINDGNSSAVVAIGLRAARAAVRLSSRPVIFSQVFNYAQNELLTANSRGVAATAPLAAQLAVWTELDPGIADIGLIVGEGHEILIESATIAALEQGVHLNVRVSRSDQETLYYYKRMVTDIDGFWMMPDNRILSARVIREILDDARRRNLAVAVPHDAMLGLGAAISFTTAPSNVAETIFDVLTRIDEGGIEAVPELTELSEIRVRTNDAALRKRMVAARAGNDAEEAE